MTLKGECNDIILNLVAWMRVPHAYLGGPNQYAQFCVICRRQYFFKLMKIKRSLYMTDRRTHGSLNCKGASRPNILEKYCLRQIIQNCAYIDYWSIFDHLEMHVVPSFMQLRYCIALSRASSHFYQNIVYFSVLYYISNHHIHYTGYTFLNIFFDGIFSNSTSIFRQNL